MNTLLTVLFVLGAAVIVARVARSVLKPKGEAEAPARAPEDPAREEEPPGPLDDFALAFLPAYVRPGHGFLVLRDRLMDRLELDGFDAGNPEEPHPKFSGGFRGYFNVPPGRHTLTAHWQDKSTTWEVEVEPNQAYVRRMDWDAGGWVDDEPGVAEHYRDLARSGSMLQAQALRPWPRPSLYFIDAPSPLVVNGRAFPFQGKLGGLVNLPPGEIQIETASHSAGCTLPADSMQVIDFSSGKPDFVDPTLGAMLVRAYLRRAPREALVSYADFSALPTAEEALRTAQSAIDVMQAALSGAPVRKFEDKDLETYERAFERYRVEKSGGLPGYVEALRAHYVVDSAMAEQADYFERYAERVAAHLKAAPELTQTEALTYLRYLAEDLGDTGVEALKARGESLGALLPPR